MVNFANPAFFAPAWSGALLPGLVAPSLPVVPPSWGLQGLAATSPISQPAPPFSQLGALFGRQGYKTGPGPYPVATVDRLPLFDASRNREVPVKVFYPAGYIGGPLPVVVFSHGFGADSDSYDNFNQGLASQGYVVIAPTHRGSDSQAVQQLGFREAGRQFSNDLSLTTDRARDISFVIDNLGRIDQTIPVTLDPSRIGVAGHSAGASTALLIGGVPIDLPGAQNVSFRDPRVSAVLTLSPQSGGVRGIDEAAFGGLAVPFLGISGTRDRTPDVPNPLRRLDAIRNAPVANDNYFLLLRDANHLSFADVGARLGDPQRQQQIQGQVDSAAVAFFDSTLRSNPLAFGYLNGPGINRFVQGQGFFFRR